MGWLILVKIFENQVKVIKGFFKIILIKTSQQALQFFTGQLLTKSDETAM
jgi:hypothetical protein